VSRLFAKACENQKTLIEFLKRRPGILGFKNTPECPRDGGVTKLAKHSSGSRNIAGTAGTPKRKPSYIGGMIEANHRLYPC